MTAGPGVGTSTSAILQPLEKAVHETVEPLVSEEVAPVQEDLIEQCEEVNRKLDAMNGPLVPFEQLDEQLEQIKRKLEAVTRPCQPMVAPLTKPAGMSVANLVNPEPPNASDAAPKRKADVLDIDEGRLQAEQTLITVEKSMAAELAKNECVDASRARPHKRPRTLLKEGLKATAYVVAGGVATFGFLLSPWADRLAQA